ncbi:hypothetical protein D3C76_1707900 [compost metagenome]
MLLMALAIPLSMPVKRKISNYRSSNCCKKDAIRPGRALRLWSSGMLSGAVGYGQSLIWLLWHARLAT